MKSETDNETWSLIEQRNKLMADNTTLRTQLKSVEVERDGYKHEAEMWDEHMGPLTDYEGDEAPWQTIVREFENLRDQRDKVEADAAVMRPPHPDDVPQWGRDDWAGWAKRALSTNAGKSLLLRLQEAERLLSRDTWHHNQKDWDEFQARRHTFLNPKPQDVK